MKYTHDPDFRVNSLVLAFLNSTIKVSEKDANGSAKWMRIENSN
jgi:hypothetical protein